MSLVGNFTFNDDRTQATEGPGLNSVRHTEYDQEKQEFRDQLNSDHDQQSREHIPPPDGTNKDYSDPASSSANTQSNSNTDTDDEDDDEDSRDRNVRQLAKQFTKQSTYSNVEGNPFEASPDSNVNPKSDNFKARAWVTSILKLAESDQNSISRQAGIAFRGLGAHGYGAATDFQKSVANTPFKLWDALRRSLGGAKQRRIDIFKDFEGLVHAGELLVVLGKPGAGCSTFLKTIAGETHGFIVNQESNVNYQGITYQKMHKAFRGEVLYNSEVDIHFPSLTVGDTLYFAARARAPRIIPGGITPHQFAEHLRDVIMATFGISHTLNTKVGNDYIRGVSGGERKRVSIAEAALNGSPIQCWDNSTRGLDSANAIEFCKILRIESDLLHSTAAVAIYQAPQAAYDIFDKVILLYEGREIFFGRTTEARGFFERLGFECPERQTTADFLTSMTSPNERIVRKGAHGAPRTPDEFAAAWKQSSERARLMEEIAVYEQNHPLDGADLERFTDSRRQQQAKRQRVGSPYTLSYGQQINLCLWRGFARLKADPFITLFQLFGNFVMALVISSVFYNLQLTTDSFYARGALLFFAILLNAFGSALEILTLYAQRPIVEKHQRYALYHPSAEAFASMLTDMPYKILNAIIFNLTLYFISNLRRDPGHFFFFLLISFFLTLAMSMLFRTIASASRTLAQALAPCAILILAIVIYTGFAIPVDYMLGWSRWINYIDVVAYGFEALMINEFHGQEYDCSSFVPAYGSGDNRVCSAVGSVAGATTVSGTEYIRLVYNYQHGHKWRNFGIMIAFMIGFMILYLIAAELVSAKKSKGEVLLFRRGEIPSVMADKNGNDSEAAIVKEPSRAETMTEKDVSEVIQKQTAIFSWKDVTYDIKIKGEPRRILDHVDGWIKPGTLTGLMGVSGAGKTTLLDVLATRTTMGVITGEILVDGRQRDSSFQRKIGYCQQQDLHLETTTVREALTFSAVLRQPAHVSRQEKTDYVEEVIKLLEMSDYADAIIGVTGEGLNVEQRKRLTIGVELAAKPQLLLFLDEPTSGLDSQTSWSILDLLEKLKNNGQAIVVTLHQPSAMLFQRLDRLLFLAKGGRTVYYGDIGASSQTLTSYFARNGARECRPAENPAEYMLESIGAAPGSHSDVDWPAVWRASPEYKAVHAELEQIKNERAQIVQPNEDKASYREFAAPFYVQLWEVQKRVFQQYWYTPSYIYSKLVLCAASGLFVGFSFYNASLTIQGLQNQLFSVFLLLTIFSQLVQQIMPLFVSQRALYEVRERPSKAYSWKAFMIANILVEIPWASLSANLLYLTWYYPVGFYRNAEPTDTVHSRGFTMFLFVWVFLLFSSTFSQMIIAGIQEAEMGGNIANLMFSLSLIFCGVLRGPSALPGFWIFMYRVSPFTYLVEAFLSVAVKDTLVTCAQNEFLRFDPPSGQSCSEYMQPQIDTLGGYLQDENAQSNCSFCSIRESNTFLRGVSVSPDNDWRNFGILWGYIIFNVCAAMFLYWLARVPKGNKNKVKEVSGTSEPPKQIEGGIEKVFTSGE